VIGLLLPRLLLALGAVLLGGGIGLALGARFGLPATGAALGAVMLLCLAAAREWRHAARLMAWLRSDQVQDAPRDGGLWAEVAYRTERALRLRERQARQQAGRLDDFLNAIEASPNGVLLLDAQGHITWCNQVAALHMGLDPQRDIGQHLKNLVRAPAFVAYLQSGHWQEPVSFLRPGGDGTLQVLLRAYGEGQTLLVSQDITERLRAESMRRDFVANVSHEIRSPLTVLAGFVETMQSLPLSEVERGRVLVLMQQQTDRMQQLVSDLLTLAQLEGSPWPSSDRWVSVAALVARVMADAQGLSGQRHQIRQLPAAGPDVEVAGSEAELVSALGNLAFNAVRYTPDGGRIELAWGLRADGCLVVDVRDSGIGIAREHLPRLTERFYRVDSSRSRDTGGTGLGLAIVKHVVQRHGGELQIESTPGQGSLFRLVLPAARVRPGALALPAGLAPSAPGGTAPSAPAPV